MGGINLEDVAAVSGNQVFINRGAVGDASGGAVFGGRASSAANNQVTFSGDSSVVGHPWFSIYATYGVHAVGGWGGTVTGNSVTIDSSGTFSGGVIVGGMGSSLVTGNTVTVKNGQIQGTTGTSFGYAIVGGFASWAVPAVVTGNTVNISGGTVTGEVVAAKIYRLCNIAVGDHYEASGNTVNISGSPQLGAASLRGAYDLIVSSSPFPVPCAVSPSDPQPVIANNVLNLYSPSVTAGNVMDFDKLNFFLPDGLVAGTPMLSVPNFSVPAPANSSISVSLDPSAMTLALNDGDTYTLIHTTGGAGALSIPGALSKLRTGTITDTAGASFGYSMEVAGNDLVLKIGTPPVLQPTTAAAVPATGPATLALLALGVMGLGAWTRRRAQRRAG
jgi:hypothetical protein